MLSRISTRSHGWLVFGLAALFLFGEFVAGHSWDLMDNARCFPYIGCNAGLWGYDAVLHTLSGVIAVVALLWLGRIWSRFDFYSYTPLRRGVSIFIILLAIGIGWETWEFSVDQLVVGSVNPQLIRFGVPLQPSALDTVGDLVVSTVGGLVTLVVCGAFRRKKS